MLVYLMERKNFLIGRHTSFECVENTPMYSYESLSPTMFHDEETF